MVGKNRLALALAGLSVMMVGLFAVMLAGVYFHINTQLVQIAILMLSCLLLAWAARCLVSNQQRLDRIKAFAERLGAGDLTISTGVAGEEDEVALLGANLDRAVSLLRGRIGTITSASLQLVKECSELAANPPAMTSFSVNFNQSWQLAMDKSEALRDGTTTVLSQVEHVNQQMKTVNTLAQVTSQQIGAIISSTEEMSVTIADIAANAERARNVAGSAVDKVTAASNRVDELGSAALEISKVTDVIVEIAEQTKLLALNATIEAARAGEAGKGFAVVANEVKELALQTNNAIAEIRNKVEAMQQSTDNTITEIGAINQTINAVNEIVVSIAGAVEEQSVTTKDIVSKLNQGESEIRRISDTLSENTTEVLGMTNRISEVAGVSNGLAQEMMMVNQQGIDLGKTIDAAAALAGGLNKRGEEVKAETSRIRI